MTSAAAHAHRRFARKPHALVVGGGAGALEACLALEGRARVTLVAPNDTFTHPPPRATDPPVRLALARFARSAGATLLRDRVTAVDADRRRARTAGGRAIAYDALVIATGAAAPARFAPSPRAVVFVAPPGPIWRLELYEHALRAAAASRERRVVIATTEERPLELLGVRGSELASAALATAGVVVHTASYPAAVLPGGVRLWPAGELVEGIPAVAPRLAGCVPRGVPTDAGGFVATDPLGRVTGLEHVYAAGDCTAFPVKHASLAAGQADAAAATIAGAPEPFDPVLRWVLPGWPQWYVEAPLAGGKGEATRLTTASSWSAAACFGSRHLTPLLGRACGPRARRDEEIEPVLRAFRRLAAARRR